MTELITKENAKQIIREFIFLKNISQRQICEDINLSERSLSRLLNGGVKKPKIGTIIKLNKYFERRGFIKDIERILDNIENK